jgi:acetylornithine deacetylase
MAHVLDTPAALAQLTSQLVQIPSVNPMGGPVDPEICYEGRLSRFLHEMLVDWGLPVERQPVEPGRDNLLTRIEGRSNAPLILLEVHQDTVPVAGMTVDPFGGQIRGGRVWGRGACDVKGGMSTVLGLLQHLARNDGPWPSVVAAFCINEEFGFSGARHLRIQWERRQSDLLPRPPDMIVVTEPTDCQVVVAHKGVVRWELTTLGRAAHSSQPQLGESAIYRMAHVLHVLEAYAALLPGSVAPHPLLGGPTLSVGTISGGLSANTVPDRCTIALDRRLLPGESPDLAREGLETYLLGALAGDAHNWLVHAPPFMSSCGLQSVGNGALASEIQQAARTCGVPCRAVGAHYGTDASELGITGIPTVVFGPGSILQAHTADEWIDQGELIRAQAILTELCRQVGQRNLLRG